MEHHNTEHRHESQSGEISVDGTALEQVSAYLRHAIREADARLQVIDHEDAQAIATLLAALLAPDAEMQRFAESGQGDAAQLHAECRRLQKRHPRTPDTGLWIARFEAFLAAHEDPETAD